MIAECDRLGILVDLAHATPATVQGALAVSKVPMIFSHGAVVTGPKPHRGPSATWVPRTCSRIRLGLTTSAETSVALALRKASAGEAAASVLDGVSDMRSGGTLMATCVLSMVAAHAAAAEEVLICPDKTLVRIDATRRAQQYEHACVKAWFGGNGAQPAPAGTPAAGSPRPDVGFSEAVKMTRAGIRR